MWLEMTQGIPDKQVEHIGDLNPLERKMGARKDIPRHLK